MEIHHRRSRVWFLLTRYADAIAESTRMLGLARQARDRHAEGHALFDLALEHYATFSTENIPAVKPLAEEAHASALWTGHHPVRPNRLTYLALPAQAGC